MLQAQIPTAVSPSQNSKARLAFTFFLKNVKGIECARAVKSNVQSGSHKTERK